MFDRPPVRGVVGARPWRGESAPYRHVYRFRSCVAMMQRLTGAERVPLMPGLSSTWSSCASYPARWHPGPMVAVKGRTAIHARRR